jgi:oligoendopeptidase F
MTMPADASAAIPARGQIPAADTWDLSPLYASDAAWASDFENLKGRFREIGRFAGRVGESPALLAEALGFESSLNRQIERLNHYAMLRVSEDGSDAAHLAREAQLQNLLTLVAEASAFLSPEIQAIGDADFEEWLGREELALWRVPLRRIRRFKPHTLSLPEERLLALGGSALWGYHETFSQLTNVDMRFGAVKDERGVERPLSQSTFSTFLLNRSPEVRREAFGKFYAEFSGHRYTLAAAFAHSVKCDVFRARARNYPSALEAALFPDDVPVAVYDGLIAAVRANLGPLHRYYELRKRLLGLAELHQYDTYAPLVAEVEWVTPFDRAAELVLESLAPLGEEYVSVLGRGLGEGRWCDRYESAGKRSGAFSSSSYGNPPFILMNYKEQNLGEIYTLAHEAGHSMHTWLAQSHQPFQAYDYPIFLAEVASTFNEQLLTDHLLRRTSDPRERAYLLCRQIDDIRGTLYRQTMFAEFEKIVHAMEETGEPLTLDAFRGTYRSLLETYHGPPVTLDPELELECLRIPHFYGAFYVYKYATGLAAAVALSERVLGGGQEAVEDYLGFMKSGGSEFPIPTLARAGVDMASPGPVERALALFGRRVAELEELLG